MAKQIATSEPFILEGTVTEQEQAAYKQQAFVLELALVAASVVQVGTTVTGTIVAQASATSIEDFAQPFTVTNTFVLELAFVDQMELIAIMS